VCCDGEVESDVIDGEGSTIRKGNRLECSPELEGAFLVARMRGMDILNGNKG